MKKGMVKMKRSAILALTLALVWMFLLPMQAFAEENSGTPAEGTGTVSSESSSTQTEEKNSTGAAYLAPSIENATAASDVDGGNGGDQPEGQNEGGQNEGGQNEGGQNEGGQNEGGQNEDGQNGGGDQPDGQNGDGSQPGGEPNGGNQDGGNTQRSVPEGGGSTVDTTGTGEWVRFENNNDGNAIQQAVDAAIKAGQTYITVVVQNGSYTGGLNIDNSGKETIVVNIIAHDAYEHGETTINPGTGGTGTGGTGTGGTETGSTGTGGTETPTAPTANAVYPVPTISNGTVDTSKINTGSAGGVKLEGGVSVNNVELLLAGIYLTLKEQKENQGMLEGFLTKEGNVDIKVENTDKFTYYGTTQGDSANITLTDVKNAVINTGDGDDVLDVTTITSPNVDLTVNSETGAVQGDFAGAGSVNSDIQISGGDGNDKITVTESNKITYKETTQDNGPAVVNVSVHKGVNNLNVHAGDGADTITLKGSSNLVDLKYDDFPDVIANKIYEILSANINDPDSNKMVHGSKAVIEGGKGDDLLNLDTSWEQGTFGETKVDYFGETKVDYQGGEGKNRLHLTGTLNDTRDKRVDGEWKTDGSVEIKMYSKHTISRTDYRLIHTDLWVNKKVTSLDVLSPRALAVIMSGVDSLTDDLTGKKTVNVTIGSDRKIMETYQEQDNGQTVTKTREVAFLPFTDYVFTLAEGQKVPSFTNESASGLLTKLIVRGQNINVETNTQIKLPGATLMLESVTGSEGGSILVNGNLQAENIMLKVVSSDAGGVSFLEPEGDSPSIFDMNTSASVTVGQNATLTATRVVDILAKSVHSNGLLPDLTSLIPGFDFLEENEKAQKVNEYMTKIFGVDSLEMIKQAASINFVSIKFAYAVVEILGDIIAGAVKVLASNKVETDATNTALRDLGLPFALSVITAETGIKVRDGSRITANTGDISLDAQSDIKANTNALSGRLPFTVAVSVVDNQVYVDIQGGVLESTNGNIIANASGIVNLKTNASGSNVRPNNNAVVAGGSDTPISDATHVEMGKSGGFFAISVLTQDVFSAIQESAKAIAKKDISITSTGKASVVNKAASNPQEDGESMTLVKLIKVLTREEQVPGDGGWVGQIRKTVDDYLTGKSNQLQSQEEKDKIEKEKIKKQKEKKNSALSKFLDKLTGNGSDNDDDVGSLVDKATSSANQQDNTTSLQLVGALGVTYADNNNRAFIDTTGEVKADGAVSVVANGEMNVETLADGSPVKADDPAGGDKKGPQDQHYAEHKHGEVKVASLTNGTIIIDASVGEDDIVDGKTIYKVTENKNGGISRGDTFTFVVKASFGYKLEADENGKYWITNEYADMDDDPAESDADKEKKTDKIEVELVGKDADGCYLYRVKGEGYKVDHDENIFKATFVPKQKINIVNNGNAEGYDSLGTAETSTAQADGVPLYFADQGEDVYLKINVKSGVKHADPYITYLVKGSSTAQPVTINKILMGDVQEDGTVDYYYHFTMPEGEVTIDVKLTGQNMNIGLDSAIGTGAKVWISPADENPSGDPMEATDKYAGHVGDKIKIIIDLAEGTFIKNKSLMFAGDTPVYIKAITDEGVKNGERRYTCIVDIPAIIQKDAANTVTDLKLTFQTTTNEAEAQGTVQKTSTALGAGLAVDVTRYNNQAYITKVAGNTLQAGSVNVQANTSQLSASAISKAGFVAGDLGVAGAITVHLVSANNEALIGGNISAVKLGSGDLTVESNIQNSEIVTNAEAAGDGASADGVDPNSVGVGAGIAVGISNLAVVSKILDTVTIGAANADEGFGNVNINASHTGTESMTATAGASGGTSAVPVLALNISGVSVLADSGKMTNNVLKLTGDAVVKATNSMTRNITADAAAVGSGVGVGASFIIDILNDSAKAKLGRSVNAGGDVTVSADSISRLKATAKSGAQGNVSGDEGSGDAGGGETDSGTSGEEPPPSGGSDNKVDLPDDYYEGLDNLFGGGSTDNALEDDDDAESLAPLFREGEADAFVDNNKTSATQLSGLVANNNGNVNATNTKNAFENRQKAETSEGSVQVAATMVLNIQSNEALAQIDAVDSIHAGGKLTVTSRHDTDGVIMANASATKSTTGVGVAVAINTVTYTNVAQILTGKITASEVIVRASVYEEATKKTAEGFFESIKNDLLKTADKIKEFVNQILEASGKGNLEQFIRKYASDNAISISKDVESGIVQLILQWIGELLQGKTMSFPTAEQENKIKEEAVKYGKAIFGKIKGSITPKKLLYLLVGKNGLLGTLKKTIKDINLKEMATSALVNYMSGKLGGNEEAEAVGPRISTSAVSGAGASNVGVAGSVAISVVSGSSNAYIAQAENGNMTVSGNITVESKAFQEVYTSAGASVDALGNVDKNKNATDAANSNQNGNAKADAGKSVGVGAAVALSFADLISDARIGSGWTITAKDLVMNSVAENNVETTSVSGTDPLARTEDPTDKKEEDKDKDKDKEKTEAEKKAEEEKKAKKAMDYAVDASVSVTLIQNTVKAYLAENSVITLSGNLNMLSSQSGETNTNASGFAMGNETAVGAAVAINLAFSDVATQVLGSGSVAGSASLDSKTENQDDANALALAMGAEMDRYVAKLRNSEKVMAFNKEKEKEDKQDEKIKTNDTSKKISDKLKDASEVSGKDKEDKSDPSQPLSVQAIKSQNVKTENTNQTNASANNGVGSTVTNATDNKTGNAVSSTLNGQAQEGQSIHVAASVGVNVTEHSAKTEIKGNLTVGGLKANVENNGNFSTASTGAAISEATNSNCVGAAVAVSVNGNKAVIVIDDDVSIIVKDPPAPKTEEKQEQSGKQEEKKDPLIGNVALKTVLNQNSTGEALGRYGVLAIAGSSSGKGGKVGLAGSVAVLVAKGTSAILMGDGVTIIGADEAGNAKSVSGSVTVDASDTSKLSTAAMAATSSDGAAVGVGASFALLYAQNQVLAEAGDNFTVSADRFSMTATKHAVSFDDFVPDLELKKYLTVLVVDENGNGGYEADKKDEYGLFILQKNQDGSYNFFKNLNTADVLDLIQLTSVLASVNYYASAVAGTVMESKGDTSGQKAAVAGAVSMLFNDSVTRASIGNGAKITTTAATEINASSETNTRVLGGALSASGAATGIGLNVATVKQNDKVQAIVGDDAEIRVRYLEVQAHSVADMLVITAAAVSSEGTSVGGALNVVINNTGAKAQVGAATQITTTGIENLKGDVDILADSQSNVILGSVNISISGSESQGAAAGGVVTVSTNASAAEARLMGGTVVSSDGINIHANNQELVINVLAAASRSGNGAAGAGTISVLTTDAKALATVGNNAALTALNHINIKAYSHAKLIGVMAAACASTDAPAVGATIMVNVFNRESGASVGNNSVLISKLGNVLVQADSDESAIIISVAGAAASETAISGNIQVNVGDSHTYAKIGNGATIKAWNSIGVTAYENNYVVTVSPTLTIAPGSNAVGATVQTNILKGQIEALIGDNANLIAYAQESFLSGVQTANREGKRKGIILSALSRDTVIAVSLSASGGQNALAGTVETLVNEIEVRAKIGANSKATVGYTNGDDIDVAFDAGRPSDEEGELTAEADAHSTITIFGGALSATSSTGVGATVLTLVDNKTVEAEILLSTQNPSKVNGAINVTAKAEDHLTVVSVNFGVSTGTTVNVGGNVMIFQSAVNAVLSGKVTAEGNVTVQADNYTDLLNAIGSASGSIEKAAVSGAALVTYFKGSTTASVANGSQVTCKDLKVLATSTSNINSDGVGITASVAGAAVSGLVNVIVTSTRTEAFIGSGSTVNAENVQVIATDNYTLLAIGASVAGGSDSVGVNAVVTVAKNTVLAYIADNATVSCTALNVQAISNRDIRNYAGSVGVGFKSSVIINVMVAVIGGKLDQDSAKGIAKGFKPDTYLNGMKSTVPNAAKGYLENMNLSKDLEADSSKASDLHVGDDNGNYSGTDDYRNDDFDKNYTTGSNPGENFSGATNTQGSELGMDKPKDASTNVIKAYIGSGSEITVTGATLVEANEKLNVDIVTASAAVAGTAGVNLGVAVVVAYSNVWAEIQSGASVNCGDITVHAVSGGDGIIPHDKASEILSEAHIDADASGSSIRVIAVTVGVGGTAGVSPSVAVLNMASKVMARMDGVSGSGNAIKVYAETSYPKVLAVTGAVGIGGTAGVTASVAVVTFNSETYAGIINSGEITAAKLDVLSNVTNTAKAYAMSIAGGTVGVNGGVAVVTNRSTTNTLLGTGIYIISGDVAVEASVNTNAESFIVGISLGGIAVGLNAAVVNQHAVVNTRILGDTESILDVDGNVSVKNTATATAKTTVIAAVGGGIGVGGNVLLVFNNMEATAALENMPFSVDGNVTISAGMQADSEAKLAHTTIGGIAVGLSTSYVGLNAKNLAYLALDKEMAASASAIQVWAGTVDNPNSFDATATTVAGGFAGVSVGLNAAVADINASNEAKILAPGILSGKVNIQANSVAEALAEIYFASAGTVTVSAATVVSVLRIRQAAEAEIGQLNNSGEFSVLAFLNDSSNYIPSYAKLVTVSGGLYNASANVAVAYSLSQNIAKAILGSGVIVGNINVKSNGNAAAKSETVNQTASAFSGSVYVNVAYAKGQFQSIFRILDEVSGHFVTVETVYITSAWADLTPSAAKLNLSIAKFNVNLAIARAAANALVALEGGGKLVSKYNMSVKADSNHSQALANVTGAAVEANGISFAVNVADSQMALEQTVSLDHITLENTNSNINIYANADNLSSTANTGANGGKGAGFSIVGGNCNTASANVSIVNQIILNYANVAALEQWDGEVYICASGENLSVNAIASELAFQLAGISATVISTHANVTKFNNGVFMNNSHLSGNRVEAIATAKGTNVDSQSSVPRFSGSLAGTQRIIASAKILEKLTQVILNSGSVTSRHSYVYLRVFANANLEAGSAHPSGSLGAITIQDYEFTVDVDKIITEVQVDGKIDSGSNIRLTSEDNITSNITMDSTTVGGFTGVAGIVRIQVKNQTAYVKAAGDITAVRNIKIEADAYQKLSANVDIVSTSLISYGYAQPEIILYRNALVDIDGNVVSKKDSISILTQVGEMDHENIYYPDDPNHAQNYIDKVIYLNLNVVIHSFVDAAPNPTATAKLVSKALVNVAEGSLIQAENVIDRNGFISIMATGQGSVQVNVNRTVTKLFGTNAADAVADVNETVKVNIGGAAKTRILGRDVDIYARSSLYVTSICDTYGTTALGVFSPNAIVILCVDMDTIIRSTDISALFYMNIGAYTPYIYVLGHCISRKTNAVSTYNNPSVNIKGNIYGDVTIDNNTTLRAENMKITTFRPAKQNSDTVTINRLAESYIFSMKSATDEETVYSTSKGWEHFRKDSWDAFSKKYKFLSGTYNPNAKNENNVYYSGKLIWSAASLSGATTPSGQTEIYLGGDATGTYVALNGTSATVWGSSQDLVTFKDGVFYVDGSKLHTTGSQGTFSATYDTSHNKYFLKQNAVSESLTLYNNSQYDVQLDNVNQSASKPGGYLNIFQSDANSDLIFNDGGDYSNGSIYVNMAGGNVILMNGGQINAQQIYINGVGTIRNENPKNEQVVITNSGSSGYDGDTSVRIAALNALNLLLQTVNSRYTIDRVQSGADLTLEVKNTLGKQMPVELGELISGGNVTVKVPHNLESADAAHVNITGNGIVIDAGGKVGTSDQYLRVDSSVKAAPGVSVNASGGIWLAETDGDLYISEIRNYDSGDISLRTENGSIHAASKNDGTDIDGLEKLYTQMMEYVDMSQLVAVSEDTIWVLIQYIRDLLRIQADLLSQGNAVLESAMQEIDVLHDALSVEQALQIISDELLDYGGTWYQDPEVAAALMNSVIKNDQLTDEFIDEIDKMLVYDPETGGYLGYVMYIWWNAYQLAKESYVKVKRSVEDLQNDTINIYTDGNVYLQLQSASGAASVSQAVNSLNVYAGGKVSISTAANTVLENVYLECFDKLTLDPINATGVIDLYGLYGIYAANPSDQVLLNADSIVLWSLLGDLGTNDQALILNTNKLDALGNLVSLENRKDLIVNMILATKDLNLTVLGDLLAMAEEEAKIVNGLFGTGINLQVTGNVGTEAEHINIAVTEYLNITAKNIYMSSTGDVLVGKIRTDNGMVSINAERGSIQNVEQGSGIWCDSLNMNSYGMIGTDESPLLIYSNGIYISTGGSMQRRLFRTTGSKGTLMAKSMLYGENVKIIHVKLGGGETATVGGGTTETVTDENTGIRVTGNVDKNAVLTVSYVSDHADCSVCQTLMQQHNNDGRIFVNLKLSGDYVGKLLVQIPADETFAAYEGKEILVLTCRDGKVWAIRATVINGMICFYTEELGSFLIFGDASGIEITQDGSQILLDGQLLPFGGWL